MHLREEKSLLAGIRPFGVLLTKIFVVIATYAALAISASLNCSAAERMTEQSAGLSSPGYHALIIGNNNYRHFPKLQTAVVDATEVDVILRTRYGFKTKLLINATRKEILNEVNFFRRELGENDHLLIYYAGHGEYDKTADKAYWLPVDAQKDNPVDWIMADDITSNIKRIAAKHVLIVSDSCYSGSMIRYAGAELKSMGDRQMFLRKMMERPSRTLMASGGNEPVWDSGGGKHSVFAAAFLKALAQTEQPVFTAEELFHGGLKEIVAGKSDQIPEYNNIKNSGHEGGDFIFRRMIKSSEPAANSPENPVRKPESSRFTIEDLEIRGAQEEQNRAAWKEKMNAMESAFHQVSTYENKDVAPSLKITAWRRLLDSFNEINPYSNKDKEIREKAHERIAYWKSRQFQGEKTDTEKKTAAIHPAAGPLPAPQMFEKPNLSVGDTWKYESDDGKEIRTYILKAKIGTKFVFQLDAIDEQGKKKSIEKVFDEHLNDEDALYPIYRFPFNPGNYWKKDYTMAELGGQSFPVVALCETSQLKTIRVPAGEFQNCSQVRCYSDLSPSVSLGTVKFTPPGPTSAWYCQKSGITVFTEENRQFKLVEFSKATR